jgi:hypothetical protein
LNRSQVIKDCPTSAAEFRFFDLTLQILGSDRRVRCLTFAHAGDMGAPGARSGGTHASCWFCTTGSACFGLVPARRPVWLKNGLTSPHHRRKVSPSVHSIRNAPSRMTLTVCLVAGRRHRTRSLQCGTHVLLSVPDEWTRGEVSIRYR